MSFYTFKKILSQHQILSEFILNINHNRKFIIIFKSFSIWFLKYVNNFSNKKNKYVIVFFILHLRTIPSLSIRAFWSAPTGFRWAVCIFGCIFRLCKNLHTYIQNKNIFKFTYKKKLFKNLCFSPQICAQNANAGDELHLLKGTLPAIQKHMSARVWRQIMQICALKFKLFFFKYFLNFKILPKCQNANAEERMGCIAVQKQSLAGPTLAQTFPANSEFGKNIFEISK